MTVHWTIAMRWVLSGALLVLVWRNTHWANALCITLLLASIEIQAWTERREHE